MKIRSTPKDCGDPAVFKLVAEVAHVGTEFHNLGEMMLFDLWDLYQQGQIDEAARNAELAKRDGIQVADRLHREVLRLESKIDTLALIAQASWELVRQETGLSDSDIGKKMAEIDARDGRIDGRITGTPTTCPKCARPANTRNRVCAFCGTPIEKGHIVEKS